MLRLISCAFAGALSLCCSAAQAEIFFTGVGDLPGGGTYSTVYGLSGDGSTAVGHSGATGTGSGDYAAFRWTRAGGMQSIGVLDTQYYEAQAHGVSYDGSVITGRSTSDAGGSISTRPFRWTAATGMQEIPNLAGGSRSGWGNAVSGDGSAVVGWMSSTNSAPDNGFAAFRWTQAGGTQELGDLPGDRYFSEATGVSHDGNTVTGYSNSTAGVQAMRWTQATGMLPLGDLAGGTFNSRAEAISADGSVIVGAGTSANGREAFRWVNGVMTGLGDLAGGSFTSWAYDVTADGNVIVGLGTTIDGQRAMIWDAVNGMRLLSDFLTASGVNLNGWTLTSAYGVSDDGLVFAGTGINPNNQSEGWVAQIEPAAVPEPSSMTLLALVAGCGIIGGARKRRRRT